jgi:2-dehydropantoate 2-reductase
MDQGYLVRPHIYSSAFSLMSRNCCWNSITTVTRVKTNRFFESSPQALPMCHTVMEEVVAVARAKGMTVPDDTVEKLIKQCTDVKTGLPSSMMADNFAGRPMEVEVILGTPVKEAERLGVKVPTLLT